MTVVHNQNPQVNPARCKVILHQSAPALFFPLRDLGKSISRQIHQIALPVNNEIIHMDGLSRLVSHPGKVLSLQKAVDHRGFAHIGFSGKGNFRQPVLGEGTGRCRRNQKLHILKVHITSPTAGSPVWGAWPSHLPEYPSGWPDEPLYCGSAPHPEPYPPSLP